MGNISMQLLPGEDFRFGFGLGFVWCSFAVYQCLPRVASGSVACKVGLGSISAFGI